MFISFSLSHSLGSTVFNYDVWISLPTRPFFISAFFVSQHFNFFSLFLALSPSAFFSLPPWTISLSLHPFTYHPSIKDRKWANLDPSRPQIQKPTCCENKKIASFSLALCCSLQKKKSLPIACLLSTPPSSVFFSFFPPLCSFFSCFCW